MTLTTRKPTGQAPWPMLLIAGGEKCGKSYAAAAFSASELIDRTLYVEVGEGAADLYGALPGARYEIVEHNGSYAQILDAVTEITQLKAPKKPHAIVIDSMTEVWDLLCNEQQSIASKRGKDTITMDQWNTAKRRWRRLIDALRLHHGPVILTARFEQVTQMDERGRPTAQKEWKIRAEKNLAFEVDGIIEIPKPQQYFLTGMRSLTMVVPAGEHRPLPGFTLDGFLRELNVAGTRRAYTAPVEDPNAYTPSIRPLEEHEGSRQQS